MRAKGLFDYSIVRAEQDTMVVGARRGQGVTFVAAVAPGVVRTESGVQVGTKLNELATKLGPPVPTIGVIRDARIRAYVNFPNTRFIVDSDRVVAILVGGDSPQPRSGVSASICKIDQLDISAIRRGQGKTFPANASIAFGCAEQTRAITLTDNRLTLMIRRGGQWKKIAGRKSIHFEADGFVDVDGDGLDEVVVVSRIRRKQQHDVRLELLGNNLSTRLEWPIYSLATRAAEWVGAEQLDDADFLIEVERVARGLRVSGVYIQRRRGLTHHVIPLNSLTVSKKMGFKKTGLPAPKSKASSN